MINRMNEFEPADDLCDDVHLAACLDIKYSDLRWTMLNDPSRLPKPFWLSRRPSWPWSQLQAWLAAGQPRDFEFPPGDFMPAAITAFCKGRPDDLYAEWAALDADTWGVFYKESAK